MPRKLLAGLGITVLFILTFIVAVFLVFPMDAVRHFAEKTVEKQLKQKHSVEIEKMSVRPLLNVTLQKVKLTPREVDDSASNMATAEGEYNGYFCPGTVETMPFTIDEIFVNPAIFSSIGGNPGGEFAIKLAHGEVEGELITKTLGRGDEESTDGNREENETIKAEKAKNRSRAKVKNNADEDSENRADSKSRQNAKTSAAAKKNQLMNIKADGKNISLSDLGILSNTLRALIYGTLDFNANVVLQQSKIINMELNSTIYETAVCPKRIKLNMGGIPYLELPFIMLGAVDVDIEIKDDKLVINSFTSTGPDIIVDASGDVSLKSQKTPVPRFNLSIKVTPSPEWLEKNSMDSIYTMCRRQDDGSIQISLKGTTKKPKMDCGTPIPVEKTAVQKTEKASDDAAAEIDDQAKIEKKVEPDPEQKADSEKTADDRPKRRMVHEADSERTGITNGAPPVGRPRNAPERPTAPTGRASRRPSDDELANIARSPKARQMLEKIEGDIERDINAKRRGDIELNLK